MWNRAGEISEDLISRVIAGFLLVTGQAVHSTLAAILWIVDHACDGIGCWILQQLVRLTVLGSIFASLYCVWMLPAAAAPASQGTRREIVLPEA